IHYDRRYVTEVEGYPGLVVHGPLLATLLLDLLRREQPQAWVRQFRFRASKPLFDTASFELCGRLAAADNAELWTRDLDGDQTMSATATLAWFAACRRIAVLNEEDEYQDIRDAVRQLCQQYGDEYFRQVDADNAYPEAFVEALIEAGWLAAMIPEEYGGAGL